MLKPLGYSLDWLAFADAWRGEYQGAMDEVRTGRIPFCKLDVLHRRNLELILPRFKVDTLSDAQKAELNLAWHKLDAWPDVPPGMKRLKRKYKLAPVSNGNISLMVDLARRNDIPWDAILGAEIAGDYKPKPRVYLAAAEALDLAPHECMMVAAHTNDLMSAAKQSACAPATSRGRTRRVPAAAKRRRASRSISRRRVSRIWRSSSASERSLTG